MTDDLAAAVDALAVERDARVSAWCGDQAGTPWLAREPDAEHPAASTFKAALVVALHRAVAERTAALDEEVEVHDVLPGAEPGTTFTTTRGYDNEDEVWERLGRPAPLGWLAERALVRSSNLATNLLLARLGLAAVEATYAAAGATGCRVERAIEDPSPGRHNTVTARGLAAFLAALARGDLLDPAATASVLGLLGRVEDPMAAAGLPPGTWFGHKPGWFEGVGHDHGLVRPPDGPPFVLVVLTASDLDGPGVERLVADVARLCWQHRPR